MPASKRILRSQNADLRVEKAAANVTTRKKRLVAESAASGRGTTARGRLSRFANKENSPTSPLRSAGLDGTSGEEGTDWTPTPRKLVVRLRQLRIDDEQLDHFFPADRDAREDEEDIDSLFESSESSVHSGDSSDGGVEDDDLQLSSRRCVKSPRRLKADAASSTRQTTAPQRGQVKKAAVGRPSLAAKRATDTLETVRRRLHTCETPQRLPCRDAEYQRVHEFLRQFLNTGFSQCMYISGVPGTGKTATVLRAIRDLQTTDKHDFTFIETNAMRLPDPRHFYVEVFRAVSGRARAKRIAASSARQKLNEIFNYKSVSRLPIVLLVDELDLLCTRRQEIIYDVFNWANVAESRLAVIAIANTLDLPERLLNQRISSRIGTNRMCFQPYAHDEIVSIVDDRVAGSRAVEKDAVELASRKVAALSGDLRKSLDMMRRAVEIAIETGDNTLTMRHVQLAIAEMSSTIGIDFVRSLSFHGRVLLRAVVQTRDRTGLEEVKMEEVLSEYRQMCTHFHGCDPLKPTSVYRLIIDMSSSRLLVLSPGGKGVFGRRVRLGLSNEDVLFALKQAEKERDKD